MKAFLFLMIAPFFPVLSQTKKYIWGKIFISVWFQDNLSEIDPTVFNGEFAIFSFGSFFGSLTPMTLGRSLGDASGWGLSSDLFSAYGGKGTSTVVASSIEDCCE